jgi:hypothetical protein
MSPSLSSFPSHEEALSLHLRLQEQDPTASADVCKAFLTPLLHWLAGKYPHVDPHLRQSAVHEALVNYVQRPDAFQPGRLDLAAYLRMAASADCRNALRQEMRHSRQRIPWDLVELDPECGNLSGREPEPVVLVRQQEEKFARERFLDTVKASMSAAEQGVLELILEGERKTAAFARVLGLENRPVKEQEQEVKRVKDRIKKRLERGRKTDG